MLQYRVTTSKASGWRPNREEEARWEAGARARLGPLALFHHPRLAVLGLSQDPRAGRLHHLDWAPGDGLPPLPLSLVETTHFLGALPVPVLTFPTHRMYIYAAAATAPGLLDGLLGPGLRAAPARLRFFPRLPMGPEEFAARGAARPGVEFRQEDVAPRVLLRERWEGSWESYWKARDEVIRRAPRRRRQMEAEGGLVFRSATAMDEEARKALERGMDHHSSRWGDRVHGESDLNQEAPRVRLREMARHFELCGALRLDWLVWKGDVAAMVLGARSGDTWFFYWATFDPAAGRYSPGNVLYMSLLERAFAEGAAVADYMMGAAAYKERWIDRCPGVGVALAPGPAAAGQMLFGAVKAAWWMKERMTRRSA